MTQKICCLDFALPLLLLMAAQLADWRTESAHHDSSTASPVVVLLRTNHCMQCKRDLPFVGQSAWTILNAVCKQNEKQTPACLWRKSIRKWRRNWPIIWKCLYFRLSLCCSRREHWRIGVLHQHTMIYSKHVRGQSKRVRLRIGRFTENTSLHAMQEWLAVCSAICMNHFEGGISTQWKKLQPAVGAKSSEIQTKIDQQFDCVSTVRVPSCFSIR